MSAQERKSKWSVGILVVLLTTLALPACSLLFPYTERAIQPAGTTLEELGIAILADIERWFDSVIYLLGLFGL